MFALMTVGFSYSQDVKLDGPASAQSIVTCAGNFFDAGGDGDRFNTTSFYKGGENDTIVFCPDLPAGKKLRFNVVDFRLQQNDNLIIFDGNSVAANQLGIYSSGSNGYSLNAGDVVQASTSNTTGCLTFVFTSDLDTKEDQGWKFEIECYFPCQEIIATGTFNGLTPQQRNAPIKICMNDIVDLAGFGIYPDINTPKELYPQDNASSQFNWIVTPGNPINTGGGAGGLYQGLPSDSSKTIFQFPDSGIYHIKLEITDANPSDPIPVCKNTNYLDQIVWVSGPPIFDPKVSPQGTRALMDTICLGDTNKLIGFIQPFKHIEDCIPETGTLEFIPDGQNEGAGFTYQSKAEYKCYPIDVSIPGSGTIQRAKDILTICIDMEHSSVGDLEMTLTCPSGQSVRFLTQDLPETSDLGEPINIPGSKAQGNVYTYCFDSIALTTMAETAATLNAVQSLPAGNYKPLDPFSNFIGCEINGNWVLTVKDAFINDNGFAGNWEMTLDPSITPTFDDFFINTYPDSVWSEEIPGNPSIGTIISSTVKSDTVSVKPKVKGTYCYTMEVTDDFDCVYDTTICFVVLDKDTADFRYAEDTICEGTVGNQNPIFINNGKAGVFTVSPSTGLVVNSATGVFTVVGATTGTYRITNTVLNPQQRCPDTLSFVITIVDTVRPIITADPTYCTVDTATITNANLFESFLWSTGSVNDTAFVTNASNPLTLTATDINGCKTISNSISVVSLALVQTTDTITICEGGSAMIHGVLETAAGIYSKQFTTGGTSCDSIDVITLLYFPKVTVGPDQNMCLNNSATITASGVDLPASFTWDNGLLGASQTVSPVDTAEFIVTAIDAHGCQSKDTVSVNVSPRLDGSIGYSGASFCPGSPNIIPSSGFPVTAGGRFSSNPTDFVDSLSGEVFISTAPDNLTFTVTYKLQPFNVCNIETPITFTITSFFDGAFSYNGSDFCEGTGSISPVFPPTGTGAGAFTVSPAFGLSMNPSTGVIDLSSSAPGQYTITNSPAALCPGVNGQATIDIRPRPAQPVMAATTPICEGATANLSVTNVDATATYSWSPSGNAGPSITDNPTTSTTYSVIARSAFGCLSIPGFVNQLVNPKPVVTLTSTDATICSNEKAPLVITVTNSTGAETYAFNITPTPGVTPLTSGVFVGRNGPSGITATVATSYSVTVVNSTTGCISNAATPLSITVNPVPVITTTISPSVICANDPVTLTATGVPALLNNTISWSGGVTNGVAFVPTGSNNFIVQGFTAAGCMGSATAIVTVNPLPIITIAGNLAQICDDGHSEILTASGGATYLWSNGATNNPTTVVPTVAGNTFTVTGTDALGCENTASFSFNVIANNIDAIVLANPITGNPGQVVDFTNLTTGADNYTWDFGNGSQTVIVNTLVGQQSTYTDLGIYESVLATSNASGCVDTARVTVTITPFLGPIIIVPNVFTPDGTGANDTFFIDVTNDMGKSMHVEIYNRWGNALKVIEDFKDSWDGTDMSNGNKVSEGVYFFKYKIIGMDDKEYVGQGNVTLVRK